MITIEIAMDIKALQKEGHSIRQIAVITGHSRNTVRKILRGEHPMKFQTPQKDSILDPFKEYLKKRYDEYGLSAVRLIEEIKPMGYEGSVATVRRYLGSLKPHKTRLQKLTVRFETPPGKQAQVDWAYCGKFPDKQGRKHSVYAFVMVLGYSRMLYACFTTSMKIKELIECHKQGFEFFDGWPEQIVYDNMKQVRVSRSKWNEGFLDFCHHYGFSPKTHQPYRPRTKGKVERAVDYLKNNFLVGREFDDLEDLNTQGLHWLNGTANIRVHATTGVPPIELFPQEKLTALNTIKAYHWNEPVSRKVSWESMVRFDGSRYSVPPEHAGKSVSIEAIAGVITIRSEDLIIAEHKQALKPGQSIVNKDHLAEIWKLTCEQVKPPENSPRWNIRFDQNVEQVELSTFEEANS